MERGHIITLTSYRGGIGRTMAVANMAWMLASAGKRVMAIDWNLRAPRLIEFFHPFYDRELDPRTKPGIIDVLWEYVLELYSESPGTTPVSDSVMLKAVRVEWTFPQSGGLFLLNAGYPDTYKVRTELFPYQNFFGELGGSHFMEELREFLHAVFDYVIIDAPLILDDTGALCTGTLPDTVGVCFTPFGNEPLAAAHAFRQIQRIGTKHHPVNQPHKVVPLIMRTERSEMHLHSEALRQIKTAFGDNGGNFDLEVPQVPFYNYQQALVNFADRSRSQGGLYKAYENILRHLIDDDGFSSPQPSEAESEVVMKLYAVPIEPLPIRSQTSIFGSSRPQPSNKDNNHFFISYKRGEFERFVHIITQIQIMGFNVWWDEGIHGGVKWKDYLRKKIEASRALILFISKKSIHSEWVMDEVNMARRAGKPILPIKLDDPDLTSELGKLLEDYQFIEDVGTVLSKKLETALRHICSDPHEEYV